VSLGNDIVDLHDREAQPAGLHPRFDARVFGPRELEALEEAGSRHQLRWTLWAAKESAYKASKRRNPQIVFSPREFVTDLSPPPAPGRPGMVSGKVIHRGEVFDLAVYLDGRSVHAVARTGLSSDVRLLLRVGRATSDPSAAVRRLATATIAAALEVAPADVGVCERPPVATYRGLQLDATLSLAHHGRFVAVVCALPPRVTLGVGTSIPTADGLPRLEPEAARVASGQAPAPGAR
jgi:phosphopantetheinyl transferase (holo-ACP synthase)